MHRPPGYRHLFDIPDDVAYFNLAYYAPQLNASTDALIAGAREKAAPWTRTVDDFFRDSETVRVLAARIFGGAADSYAIVPSASYAMSTVARALQPTLRRTHRIIVLAEAFPSNALPWIQLARDTGAQLITVDRPDDQDWTRAILAAIDDDTRVIATPHCHWTNGARIDLEQVGRAARAVGAVLAVDATQSLGAMPLDLDRVKPDFLVSSGYKWLLCPYGFGLFYVDPQWHHLRPLEESWQSRDNAADFANLVRYSPTYLPGARRFDMGEKGRPTILPGAVKALEQIEKWTVAGIADTLAAINGDIARHAAGLGLTPPPDASRSPHMFGLTLPKGRDIPGDIPMVQALAQRNIFVSQRGNAIRIAPHMHVTANDVDRLLQGLGDLMAQ